MSMLAGPRRKQKVINLRAKNNAWSNDNTKFGQRMLEKMGWSSGKGLGANENGIVEHVVAKYKNDDRGLGFEDKNDQWTKHEDDFNALLANLSNAEPKEEVMHSGTSLEDKSKKSKARIHYHKFTRGKDISKYSEKDLANIFGKKTFKNEQPPDQAIIEEERAEKKFTEKGSMEDYFKTKLAALKSKNVTIPSNDYSENDYDSEYQFKGFAGTTNDDEEELRSGQGFGFLPFCSTESSLEADQESAPQKIKKKKQKKDSIPDQPEIPIVSKKKNLKLQEDESKPEPVEVQSKKKKSKKNHDYNETPVTLLEETTVKKKKCKSKHSDEKNQEDTNNEESYVPKKKKKRKDKLKHTE